jgi:outer membrane protein OmpA-like peptidoglycan-associated protein/osmotically-inducible protein OsmY
MPPQANGPEQDKRPGLTAEDPWPVPDDSNVPDTADESEDDQHPMGHDELVALRSSRHVARRPRRRRRWPWVALLITILIGAAGFAFYLFGWPAVQDFLVERNITSATAGYPALNTSFSDGIVSVSGEIATAADAEAVLAALQAVDGVDEVRSQMIVAAGSAGVDPLAAAVSDALAAAGLTGVTPLVDGSTVTLIGAVENADTIGIASEIAIGVDGVSQVLNRVVVAAEAASGAQQVLEAAGYPGVTVALSGNVAVLTGSVTSDAEALNAATVVMGLPGIEKVDNRLVVGTAPSPVTTNPPPSPANTTLVAALEAAGFSDVTVSLDGDTAYIDGVVPFEVLESGYFSYVDEVRSIITDFAPSASVVNRLRLRGNELELRAQLQALLEESPIVFLSGSSDLTIQSQEALDQAAKIILSQPGLQIFIAGHTDATGAADVNEQLARARGGAVYGYLVSVGVPANRMAVVSYGELFPGQGESSADDRRIEFEVGP